MCVCGGGGGGLFDTLLILCVCPLTKKWSVYNFNGRCIWTVRDRITTNKYRKTHFKKVIIDLHFNESNKYLIPYQSARFEGLKSCSAHKDPCSRKHMYRPVWSLPMIQRETVWKCSGQMKPKSSSLASTQLTVFGVGGMLPVIPRIPSPPSNMEVETLCFGVFFCWRDSTTAPSKGRWTGPCTSGPGHWSQLGHWKWVGDGYFSMKMTRNTRPRQQRSGPRSSTLRSWSGLASLQTLIP